MAAAKRATVTEILEEFEQDPAAMAAEILALRRVIEELRSLLADDEPRGPYVIVSPPPPPPAEPPPEPWRPMPPRMAAS